MIRYWYSETMTEIKQQNNQPVLEIHINGSWLPYTCITYTPAHGLYHNDVELVAIDTFKDEHRLRRRSYGMTQEIELKQTKG